MLKDIASYSILVLLSLSCLGWSYSAARKNNQGNKCYQKGEYEQALKKYSEAMTEAPEKPELYFNVGDALYKQSRFPESLKLYEKSAAPGDVKLQSKVFYNIGNSRFRTGMAGSDLNVLQEAAACYMKALEFNPGDRDAKYNLEFARREIKKIEGQKKKEDEKKREEKKKEEQKEQEKKEQEQKEREKKEQEKKEQDQKEQKKEGQKKEEEKKEKEQQEKQQKEQQEKEQKEKEQREKEQKEQEQQEKEQQGQQTQQEKAQAGKKEARELTEQQARELVQSFEREQRDPTHFIKTQIAPVPKEVEKDW